jgi:hypothetical protein
LLIDSASGASLARFFAVQGCQPRLAAFWSCYVTLKKNHKNKK